MVKEFAGAHSVEVAALAQWQRTNGNTDFANDMMHGEIPGGGEVYEPYTTVRCAMAPELDEVDMAPWIGDLMFGKRTRVDWSTAASSTTKNPVVVGMALACQTDGTPIGQMDLPDNGRNNQGVRCEVDYSPTMVLEIKARDNDSFHDSAKFSKKEVGGRMVLHMDFPPGQVVQWNTYEQTNVSDNWGQNVKVHTGIFVGCISPSSKQSKKRTTVNTEIYPIVIQILQGQSYEDVCSWLVKKLLLAHHEHKSTKTLVELGGKAHYNRTGKEVAQSARARLIAAAVGKGIASCTGWSAEEELQLLWQIQSGVYKDTGGSAEFSGGQSKGMMVLPPFKVYAETDGNLGQTPIWSTGVTMSDARLQSTVLL